MPQADDANLLTLFLFLSQLTQHRNPPLPLDLEIPYNDDLSVRSSGGSRDEEYQSDQPASPNFNNNHRNIIGNNYNPNSDFNLRYIITKPNVHKNVLSNVASYDGNNGNQNRVNNNFTATNQQSNTNSKPNHKTHVEIITKYGSTKKPNILGNSYNPDSIFAHNNPPNNKHYPHYKDRNELMFDGHNSKPSMSTSLADRKSTCMLYLQADHTFFQKLGSDEASIEAITRHVQRANVIYKNTGERSPLPSRARHELSAEEI